MSALVKFAAVGALLMLCCAIGLIAIVAYPSPGEREVDDE